MASSNYQSLIQKLDEFIRKYYKNQLLKGSLLSISLVAAFFVSATTLEYFGRFNPTPRAILFWSFVATTGFVLVRWVIAPTLKLNKLGKVISHEQAAHIVGRHFKDQVSDKLLNTLQLQQMAASNPNSELLMAGINQKIEELKPVPFTAAIDLRENRKYLRFVLPPLLAMVLIYVTAPKIFSEGTDRLVRHNTHFEAEAPFQFEVLNESLQTVQQEDFELNVRLSGEVPENVYIQFEDSRFRLKKDGKINFSYLFKNVQATTQFRLFADGFTSRDYELEAIPNPTVLNFDIALDYPAYIGRKNETVHNTGDLVVPAGTKVRWEFNTQNASKVALRLNDSTYALTPLDPNTYSFTRSMFSNQRYSIAAENDFLRSRDSLVYVVNVVPDQYPGIEVEERADSLNSKRVYFRGQVKDDYGFTALNFHYKFVKANSDTLPNRTGMHTLPIGVNKGKTQDGFFHFWDLAELQLKAGEEIEYYFEVWDNDGVNGAKSTRSQSKIFKAPTLEEISEQTEKNNNEIKEDLEDAIMEARDLQREMQKLERRVLEKKELGWEDKKQLRDMLQKQKGLQQMVESLQEENKQNNQQQSEFTQQDERVLEKQRQLEKLFNEIMNEEMKELFKELEEMMDKLDKKELQEKLEEVDLTDKDIEKELDRALELFKQLEFEQKMQDNIDKLNELKQKQDELQKETEAGEKSDEELAEEQEKLNEEFEKLQEDMEEMQEMNKELENPNDIPETKEKSEEIEQSMQESSEQLQQGKNKKSSESQQNSSDQMEQLSQMMQSAMSGMQAQGQQEDMEALRQLLENLVTLSFEQENLMVSTKGLGKKDPAFVALSQKQRKLKDDAKMIEDSLFALSKRVPAISAIVNREISAINMNMEKTIDLMADRDSRKATNRQQLVMTSTNELALLLDEILQQMQQQMQSQMQGKGSCNKPGGSSPKPSAASMRKLQQQLNQRIKDMQQAMDGKQQPGQKGKPGEAPGGQGGNQSKELAKMAAEQEALRNELRKLEEELQKEGGGGKGDMKKLADLMEQTETDLVNKNITRETIRRQQEILSRLLEHEKAEREREMDNERQSNEAKNQNFSNPAEFFEYNRSKQKEVELLKTVPPALNPFYKGKVSEYFNNF